jgi:hypothetical protein
VNSPGARVRLKVETAQLRQKVTLLTEEIRIKDAGMKRIPPQRGPHYVPIERMSVLELRAARGWNTQQTADVFLAATATVGSWMRRLNEHGPDALTQIRKPVNRFPDFVRSAVQRLKTLCPTLGKVKIAEILCRAGLHLGASTVGRMMTELPLPKPPEADVSTDRVVTANRPNHVWHIDMNAVPMGGGFWASWLPVALPQCWPFCWWMAVVVDHYWRRAMGFAVFRKRSRA